MLYCELVLRMTYWIVTSTELGPCGDWTTETFTRSILGSHWVRAFLIASASRTCDAMLLDSKTNSSAPAPNVGRMTRSPSAVERMIQIASWMRCGPLDQSRPPLVFTLIGNLNPVPMIGYWSAILAPSQQVGRDLKRCHQLLDRLRDL